MEFFSTHNVRTCAVVALVCAALLCALSFAPANRKRLNVIIISIDSLRADHVGVYGYPRDTTPNIDAWAKNGIVFQNYFSTSFLTPISEASVQTGKYPFTNGMVNFETPSASSTAFLAEILKQNGYATAAFGSSPEVEGEATGDSFKRGFEVYAPYVAVNDAGVTPSEGRGDSRPVDLSIAWLKKESAAGKPFYLWLPLGGVHQPFNQGAPSLFDDTAYRGVMKDVPMDNFQRMYGYVLNGVRYSNPDGIVPALRTASQFSAADERYVIDRYDDGIHAADALVGKLFAYLKERGLDKNTIVILESEHGDSLGERGYYWHYDIYDEGVHTPLIVSAPSVAAGKASALISGVDIVPTLLSLLQIPPIQTDGADFSAYLTGTTTTPPRGEAYLTRTPLWERIINYSPAFTAADDANHFHDSAIRTLRYKLIHRTARAALAQYSWWQKVSGIPVQLPEYELYDIQKDPGEKVNIYAAEQDTPEVVALRQKLTLWEAQMSQAQVVPPENAIQPYF